MQRTNENSGRRKLQPTNEMQRISRQELCERFDDILHIVDRDNIGFVITDQGKDDMVLCPAHWYLPMYDESFGLILNSAVRYSIGRKTYMPSTVISFIRKNMKVLDNRTIWCVIDDIKREKDNKELYLYDEWMNLWHELEQELTARNDKG